MKSPSCSPVVPDLRPRRWPPPELPDRPYPVLLPYSHPALLAGREHELAQLERLLRLPVLVLGLQAPSGTGKSSLLLGGLAPTLRAGGRPVALTRHPHEPGLAGRLLGDLLEGDAAEVADGDFRAFVDRLLAAERLARGKAPVLVLDQLEELFLRADAGPSRAVLGVLLAATASRLPGRDGPPCRWLLAYRQEHHGDVVAWLGDVLAEARSGGTPADGSLPHDLRTPDRFHALTLPPLATPPRGTDPLEEAARVFAAAIEAPLRLRRDDGTALYPWRFAPGDAARLARAFAEARVARPDAPLTPELQVVLAHLLAAAEDGVVTVPEEPDELVDRALEDHLRRALEEVFPAGRGGSSGAERGRARALLALRELASAGGQRQEGLPADVLGLAIGPGGEEILERLARPHVRLVVLREHADGWRYALSHDRMAAVVVRLVEEEGRRGALVVDSRLLALRRVVLLRSALHGERDEEATRLPRGHYRRIAANADALLWDAERRDWWAACRRRRRTDLRRQAVRAAGAALVTALLGMAAWSWAGHRAEHRALREQVALGEPQAALRAFAHLASRPAADRDELRSLLRRRELAMDLLHRGLRGVAEAERGATVLEAVETALPLVAETPDDPVLVASLLWALDVAPCREAATAGRARALWERVLEPLRRRRPPPPPPGPEDPEWVSIPGGTWRLGIDRAAWRDAPAPVIESWVRPNPSREVTVSPFRMLRHEVTGEELRRLYPDHPGKDDLPARWVTWYEAYTYAAWSGARLPTDAEWEVAARAGCPHSYCTLGGEAASADEVAWTYRQAMDPVTRDAAAQPVMRLAANQWGLFDLHGNVSEMVSDWFGPYSEGPRVDPPGPVEGEKVVSRGGNFRPFPADFEVLYHAGRLGSTPSTRLGDMGFRLAGPVCRGADTEPPQPPVAGSVAGSVTRMP